MLPLLMAGIGTAAGLTQSIIGGIQGHKARKELERLQTPQYTPSKSISDYYNQAVNRYQQSPYQSNLYKMQAQNISRGTNQGIAALQAQGGGKALGGISALIQGQNDAQLKALAGAEQDQNQKFAQLGSASQAMGAEERQAFNINKMLPYQTKKDILTQKAAGGAQLMNAGLQNISNGLQAGAIYSSGLLGNQTQPKQQEDVPSSYDRGRYLPPSAYKVPLASI